MAILEASPDTLDFLIVFFLATREAPLTFGLTDLEVSAPDLAPAPLSALRRALESKTEVLPSLNPKLEKLSPVANLTTPLAYTLPFPENLEISGRDSFLIPELTVAT